MASLVALVGVAPAGAADSTTITWTGGQPGNGTGGGALSPQPKVTGNSAIDNTTSVHLALTGGTAGAILTCDQASNTTPLVSGVTAFTGCKVDKAGTGYTLVATTIPALNSPQISNPFDVLVGSAVKLGFTTQPGSGLPGQNLSAQPVVAAQDAGGNTVVGSNPTVTLTIKPMTGTVGAVLACVPANNVQLAMAGVATFAGCKIDLAGTGYILTATSTPPLSTPAVDSSLFNVGAFHLEFSTQPGGGTGGDPWVVQPVVKIKAGNATVVSTAPITLAITQFTPATGGPGTLTCTSNPKAAVAGEATFAGCEINAGGTGYMLTATTTTIVSDPAVSDPFDIVGPTAAPRRIFGTDEIDTAIEVSRREYPLPESALAVVLARSDFFSDALAGGPLAADRHAPLLITPGTPVSTTLDPDTEAEIMRVLPEGRIVYILGGPLAVAGGIDITLEDLGYTVMRVAGPNLFATAVSIANRLGDPDTVFEATGLNFPDALSAVPAAIHTPDGAAILLTNGPTQAPETAAYLASADPTTRFAIGGPLAAAGADPTATAVYGADLFETSAAVARTFFTATHTALYGVATGVTFPDALSGGVFMATGGRLGPVLLVNTHTPLPPSIEVYLAALLPGTPGVVFGGPIAVGDDVITAIAAVVG